MKQALLLITIISLSGAMSSCLFSRKPRPAQIYIPPPPKPELPREQPIPPPPNLPPQQNSPPKTAEEQPAEPVPPPQEQPRPRRRTAQQTSTPAETPAPEQPVETAPTPATPRLGQMLSPEQQKEYSNAINSSVSRARENLKLLQSHALKPEQKAVVVQIESFLNQVEEARKYDLVAARSLAERADLLSSDLVKAVK